MNIGSFFAFAQGPYELFFATIFGFIGLMAILYSATLIRGNRAQLVEYYLFLILLIGAGLGVVFAQNLLMIFVFWELATVSLWRLVSFFRDREGIDSGLWALYVNFTASAIMLVGLVMIQIEQESWALQELANKSLPFFPSILILVGILAKSATLPLYIWLPRAYRQAPASVCALLSGVGENLGLVLYLKLFVVTVKVPELFFIISAILAVASSLVASGVAFTTKTLRDMLGYSTVGQLGFVLLGFAVSGYYGLIGGGLYLFAHAIAKAGLFFTAGIVEDSRGTGDLDRLGGFAHTSPTLAGAAGVLVLSIMGLPPTLGFFAKVGVVLGAVQKNLLLGIGALVAALFTMFYMSRLYARVFLGRDNQEVTPSPLSPMAVGIVIIMAVITIIGGILWFYPVRLLEGGM